jgi:hypothetical protein
VDGDLIIVDPGTYQENVILYKNVKLQGSGAGSTTIFATPLPAERLAAWHAKVQSVFGDDPFLANEAPGVLVLGGFGAFPTGPSLVDGFEIMGTISGGGIAVHDNSPGIAISNNRITGNQGNLGGGIVIGNPLGDPLAPPNNGFASIAYNQIIRNGGVQGGGGVSLYAGSGGYTVSNNVIAGNFSRFNGGGVSHVGLSTGGVISNNKIIFNEAAFGGAAFSDGAGIFIGGTQVLGALGEGSGSVTIDSNLIQGNLAGTGSGAGIRANAVNGTDVNVYTLTITNNMIVNNAAGYLGGGIALHDVTNASIINNTIANNDSTGTAALAFKAGASDSTPQAAGIVSEAHSDLLAAASGQTFSNPVLRNNIIWSNRSFYTTNGGAGGLLTNPAGPVWDLAVVGTAGQLSPENSILTSLTPPDGATYTGNGNMSSNPAFVGGYLNQIVTAAVIDEGGNFITVRFTPLSEGSGNYHITAASAAVDQGNSTDAPAVDIDGEARGAAIDIGADEMYEGTVPTGVVYGIAVFSNGTWYIDSNRNGAWDTGVDTQFTFGSAGDTPVSGDWNGDGKFEIGTYRDALWRVDYNGNGIWDGTPTDKEYYHGFPGGIPVTGDWNGNGITKIGVYDPATAVWFIDYNGNGVWDGTPIDKTYWHGFTGTIPVTGDWNGDGITEIGIYDPSSALWYVDYNGNGSWDGTPTDRTYWHGFAGIVPVTGNWSGSGSTKIGIYDPSSALWYVDYNGNGQWDGTPIDKQYWHGFSGVVPVTGKW